VAAESWELNGLKGEKMKKSARIATGKNRLE